MFFVYYFSNITYSLTPFENALLTGFDVCLSCIYFIFIVYNCAQHLQQKLLFTREIFGIFCYLNLYKSFTGEKKTISFIRNKIPTHIFTYMLGPIM